MTEPKDAWAAPQPSDVPAGWPSTAPVAQGGWSLSPSTTRGGWASPSWEPVERPPRDTRSTVIAVVLTLVLLMLVAALTGVVWAGVSPHIDIVQVRAGSETAFGAHLTADLLFGLLGLAVGVGAGLVSWFTGGRRHPVAVVLTLAGGGLLAALVADQVGHIIRQPGLLAQLPSTVSGGALSLLDFRVRLPAVLVMQPLAAVAVFGALALLSTRGQDRAPEPVPSWEPTSQVVVVPRG